MSPLFGWTTRVRTLHQTTPGSSAPSAARVFSLLRLRVCRSPQPNQSRLYFASANKKPNRHTFLMDDSRRRRRRWQRWWRGLAAAGTRGGGGGVGSLRRNSRQRQRGLSAARTRGGGGGGGVGSLRPGEYVDMVKAGIIDPLKVIRTALLDAARSSLYFSFVYLNIFSSAR